MNKTFTRLLTHCKASGILEKSCAYAQNRTVTGTVGDEDGQHMPWASSW